MIWVIQAYLIVVQIPLSPSEILLAFPYTPLPQLKTLGKFIYLFFFASALMDAEFQSWKT